MDNGNHESRGLGKAPELESTYSLQRFHLYETKKKLYLVGSDESSSTWRVLKIDRSEPSELNVYEDPAIYTQQECNEILRKVAKGNRSSGGLKLVTKCYGIVGFIKFLGPYYMIVITKRELLGSIRGHSIYGISESRLVTVPHSSVLTSLASSKLETRYKSLFELVDLSRDFFYSQTYRIMWCLQRNVPARKVDIMPYDDMFVWNSFLTRKFRSEVKSDLWTVAIVHGFFKQVKLMMENRNLTLTLVARRSRHYAGTRYLKRGVNEKGRVANDVETEQLVHGENVDEITSIVQHRGSIPLFWSQDTSVLLPKPDIKLHQKDGTYEATSLHFQNLAARYGNPIVILDLVKTVEKRPRETILCTEYANAVAYLNHNLPVAERIKYISLDFQSYLKRELNNVLEVLESTSREVLDLTGFYYSGKTSANDSDGVLNGLEHVIGDQQPAKETYQHGVLRTNCIDCLDRTNVAQCAFGLAALGRQLQVLGLSGTLRPGWNSSLAITMMEQYENLGDVLALQYGGSLAHNKVFSKWQGKPAATIQSQNFLRSVVRHCSNAFLDGEKQDAINIFLGHFHPEIGKPSLWQLDSDLHLQFRRCGSDPMNDLGLSFHKSFKRSCSAEDVLEKSDVADMLAHGADMLVEANAAEAADGVESSVAAGKNSLSMDDSRETLIWHDRAESPLIRSHKSFDESMGIDLRLRYGVESDRLSSVGNSPDRFWVTVAHEDNGPLIDSPRISSDREDIYRSLSGILRRVRSLTLIGSLFDGGDFDNEDLEWAEIVRHERTYNFSSEDLKWEDVNHYGTRISEEALVPRSFSERFVKWIEECRVLCL